VHGNWAARAAIRLPRVRRMVRSSAEPAETPVGRYPVSTVGGPSGPAPSSGGGRFVAMAGWLIRERGRAPRILLALLRLLRFAMPASAEPSPNEADALRLAASQLLSTYRGEAEKPASQQSVAVFRHVQGELDRMLGDVEQASVSGGSGMLAELYGAIATAYNDTYVCIDRLERAQSRERAGAAAVRAREQTSPARSWPLNARWLLWSEETVMVAEPAHLRVQWTLLQAENKEEACEAARSGRLADAETLGYVVNGRGLVFPSPTRMLRYRCFPDTVDPRRAKGN